MIYEVGGYFVGIDIEKKEYDVDKTKIFIVEDNIETISNGKNVEVTIVEDGVPIRHIDVEKSELGLTIVLKKPTKLTNIFPPFKEIWLRHPGWYFRPFEGVNYGNYDDIEEGLIPPLESFRS